MCVKSKLAFVSFFLLFFAPYAIFRDSPLGYIGCIWSDGEMARQESHKVTGAIAQVELLTAGIALNLPRSAGQPAKKKFPFLLYPTSTAHICFAFFLQFWRLKH